LSKETSRATSSETSLTTAVSTETSRATSAETSLTTALSKEIVRATSSEISISYNIANTQIVALNPITCQGNLPIYAEGNDYLLDNIVDGWLFVNNSTGYNCAVSTYFLDNAGNFTLDLSKNVVQIYFNAYINKTTGASDLPFLALYFYDDPTYPATSVSPSLYNDPGGYGNRVEFTIPSGSLNAGYYTFYANISGNAPPPTTMGSKLQQLTYYQAWTTVNKNNLFTTGTTNPSNKTNPDNATLPLVLQGISNLGIKVANITINTNAKSPVGNTNFILSDLCVQVNNQNPNINAGIYNYKFSNMSVSNAFLYKSISNLYDQLYHTSIRNTVFPGGNTGYGGNAISGVASNYYKGATGYAPFVNNILYDNSYNSVP